MPENQEALSREKVEALLDEIMDMALHTGVTLKDVRGFSDSEMEALYAVAYNLYRSGQYEKSLKLFRLLCFFDHMEPKYWLGLGAVQQMMKKYEDAAKAYAYASMLDISDPKPAVHAAECLLALGRKDEAEGALLAAIEFSKDDERHKEMRERAKTLLELMKKGGEDVNKD